MKSNNQKKKNTISGSIVKTIQHRQGPFKGINFKTYLIVWLVIYILSVSVELITRSDGSPPVTYTLFIGSPLFALIFTFFSYHAYLLFQQSSNVGMSLSGMIKRKEDNPEKLTLVSKVRIAIVVFVGALFVIGFISYITLTEYMI